MTDASTLIEELCSAPADRERELLIAALDAALKRRWITHDIWFIAKRWCEDGAYLSAADMLRPCKWVPSHVSYITKDQVSFALHPTENCWQNVLVIATTESLARAACGLRAYMEMEDG